MRKFDYEIINLKEKEFVGYKVEVLLSNPDLTDFKSLWQKVMNQFPINDDEYYIGFEDYESFTGKTFFYYALAPKRRDEEYKDFELKTVPEGKYYIYKNTLEHHGPQFFQAMYQNLKKKGVFHDSTFDIEIIPANFSYEDIDSIIYVGVKTKEY